MLMLIRRFLTVGDVDGLEKVTMECLERLGPGYGIVSNKSSEWIVVME